MVIENISINKIQPYERNPRKNDKAVPFVKKSIEEFGFKVPVIIDENNVIVCGHTRYKAAVELKMTEIPCVRADDLTPEQIKAFRLADNKVSEVAEWDFEELAEELEGITELDMEEFGFFEDATEEIDQEVEEDDYEPTVSNEPKAKPGDIYQLGRHRLMCGDSTNPTDIEKLVVGAQIDMVFTDPPYGMGLNTDYSSLNWGDRKGKKYEQGIVDDFKPEMINTILSLNVKEVFLWGADYYSEYLTNKNDGSWFVWDKTLESNGDAGSNSEFELCWSKTKHKRKVIHFNWFRYFGLSKKDTKTRIHPTQKPIQVIIPFLKDYSKENNNILDLFGGSGSTLIACEQLERNCYMMEYDPHYVDVIIDRWEKFTGQQAILLN